MAMLIGILTYLSAITYRTLALPEDWKPKSVLDNQKSSPVFIGDGANGEFRELLDLQEVKLLNPEWAIITARNNIFVLNLNNVNSDDTQIKYAQVVSWKPENSTTCSSKSSKADKSRCNNFIRINVQMSEDRFLMCGTNARLPKCREYRWNGQKFTEFYEGEKCTDVRTCLLDDVPSLAYAYAGGNLYMATRVGYRRDATLRRAPMDAKLPEAEYGVNLSASSGTTVVRDRTLPHLATDSNDASMLNDPVFISAVETKDKVFVFFRETAMEQFGNGEVSFSRVAQVCKSDRGGTKHFMSHKWTSYFKARLNCSVPGGKPFQFDELRHVTRSYVINGVTTVFAVLTTPENSIWGSAVCAYTVPEIEKAMNGEFMKRTSHDATSVCWSKHGQKASYGDPHPTSCPSGGADTRTMVNENLKFRRHHPLMQSSVQPIADQPLFMRTQARYLFTAIDAEVNVALDADGRNVTMLYIGTDDGRLLKVVPRSFDTDDKYDPDKVREDGAFVEEWEVYDEEECGRQPTGRSLGASNRKLPEIRAEPERVLSVTAVKDKNIVMVAFRNCVVTVPKGLCSQISCRKSCVQSGNPHCGWLHDVCVPVTDQNRKEVEQDLFSDRTDLPDCPLDSVGPTTTGTDVPRECIAAASVAVPIAISLSVCAMVVLVILFVVMKCKQRARGGQSKQDEHRTSSLQRDQSYSQRNASWTEGRESGRRPIYKGPRHSGGSSAGSVTRSRPASVVGQPSAAHPTYVGYGLEESSESATVDVPPPYGYVSMDSINGSFSRSTSGSVGSGDAEGRKNILVVENIKSNYNRQVDGARDAAGNLNNNNLKRNVGIAYALARAESPVRRRSLSNNEKNETEFTPGGRIRMGLAWGTSAGGTPQRQPPCWKPAHSRNASVMPVSPMPLSNDIPPSPNTPENNATEVQLSSGSRATNNTNSRKSDGMLPKPPASGFTSQVPPKSPKIVSTYSEIENSENRTFRRGRSLNEPYYSEPPNEPEYENLKHHRKASTPGDFVRKPPTPPPPNTKPNRKFSSFTAPHFNTSWFPTSLQETPRDFKIERKYNEQAENGGNGGGSTTSGVMSSTSSASVSDTQNYGVDTTYLEPCCPGRNGLKATQATLQHSLKSRPSIRSDEGYGSEFLPNEDKRMPSRPSESFRSKSETDGHVYNNISNGKPANSPIFEGLNRSPDDENIIKELGGIEWNRQNSKTKTLKKKKSSKKKKNADKRSLALDLSSPSDNENVFTDGVSTPRSNHAGLYNVYDDGTDFRKGGGQALDDSFVKCSSKYGEDAVPKNNQYAFNTMRPPGRMRQKLPRLRCGPKESDATLIAVPTPEIPKT